MMTARWHITFFTKQIAADKQKEIPVCCKCFASLVKLGA